MAEACLTVRMLYVLSSSFICLACILGKKIDAGVLVYSKLRQLYVLVVFLYICVYMRELGLPCFIRVHFCCSFCVRIPHPHQTHTQWHLTHMFVLFLVAICC